MKKWSGLGVVAVAVLLGFMLWRLVQTPSAEEASPPEAPSAFPEGSSSVIESLSWRVSGSDPVAVREQTKALVEQVSGAVVVKEGKGQLIVSLPTKELTALRQELSKLGSVSAAETESQPSAPTTLLRLTFVQP